MPLNGVLACWLVATLALVAPPRAAAQSADRLTRIQASGSLRVCIWPGYHGVSYRSPKTGEVLGFDIDNAHALAGELGVRARFVDTSFSRFIADLLDDRCDIAMFGVAATPERLQRLRFTQPHMVSDIVAVTTQASRRIRRWADIDQPGVVVAVVKGTLHETVLERRLQFARLRVLDSPHVREQEVQSGRADVFATDLPYTRGLLEHSDWARLVLPPAPFHLTPYAWAMAPGDEPFVARVESVLARFKRDGRLLAHARRHGLEQAVVTR